MLKASVEVAQARIIAKKQPKEFEGFICDEDFRQLALVPILNVSSTTSTRIHHGTDILFVGV